jgi:hypothetical protein
MHNLPKIFVLAVFGILLVMIGLPMLAPPPARQTVSTPVPANEATRIREVQTSGIPQKPTDVWAIASVAVFENHVSIEGGTMAIANIPAQAALNVVLPYEWLGEQKNLTLAQVTKSVTADGYVVPGVQLGDGQGNWNIEVIDDPKAKTVTLRPKTPLVILHSYIDLNSMRWTVTDKSLLAIGTDDTRLIEFIGDALQTNLDEMACTVVVSDDQGNTGTAVELGRKNIEGFLKAIMAQAYDSFEKQLQETQPGVHVIRPTIVVEWPDASCYVIPKQRPDAPGGARP